MIAEIIAQLKTGDLTNVIPFGQKVPTETPYVVVKPEAHPSGRGIRVIVHYAVGTTLTKINGVIKTPQDDYIYTELPTLLSDFEFINNHGETMSVVDTGEITDVGVVNDDNTISMERLFYIPLLQK